MMERLRFMVFLVGAGCTLAPPLPVLSSVTPDWAVDDDATQVHISGDNLLPRLDVNANGPDGNQLDGSFAVWLDPVAGGEAAALQAPRLAAAGELDVLVPAGLTLGDYDLRVVTPFGQSATLPGGFHVVDTRADALKIDLDAASFEAGSQGRFAVQVVDPSGAPLAADMEVRVTVVGDTVADPGVAFDPLVLEDQLSGVAEISGRLGVDGVADVTFTVARPDRYTIRVEPVDEPDVAGDDARVEVYPGEVVAVRADLPSSDFVAVAGEPFPVVFSLVDANGFVVEGASRTLAVVDACGAFGVVRTITGTTTLDVSATRATGTLSCPTDQLLISGPLDLEGRSAAFQVVPGPAASLSVSASGPSVAIGDPSVVAGTTLGVVVSPVDAYGNVASSSATIAAVTDLADGVESYSCGASVPRYCTVTVVRAALTDTLRVVDSDGLEGTSNRFGVVAGTPSRGAVTLPATTWRAGEVVSVGLTWEDAWGNGVAPAVVPDGLLVRDALGDVVCAAAAEANAWRLDCEATLVTAENRVVASLPAYGVAVESDPFAVVNGPLGVLQVEAGLGSVVAGQPLPVTVRATDAWGNAYLVQDAIALSLVDPAGTISPDFVTLDAGGEAAFNAVLTRRGPTTVRVAADAVVGQSSTVIVEAAAADHLTVSLPRRWVWVGESTSLTVESVDIYGNRTEDQRFASVSSESGAGGTVNFRIANGTASPSFTWTTTDTVDRVLANAEGLTGASDTLMVARQCGLLGPRAQLRFNNAVTGVFCGSGPEDLVTVSGSLAGSVPGFGGALSAFGFAVDDGAGQIGPANTSSMQISGYGRFDVTAVAVQADGCGAEATGQLFVGPDDGTPVGPIRVVAASPSVDLLGAQPRTTVTIDQAQTCRQTAASNVEVFVRTDRGTLGGAISSSSGLFVGLDATGSARVDLDASTAPEPGLATVEVTALSEAALGRGTVTLTGDPSPPQVWWQEPKGPLDQEWSEITLRFSEPMDVSQFTPGRFDLVGGVARHVTQVESALGGAMAVLHLDAPLTVGPAWLLTVRSDLRDAGGNAIAGAWGAGGVAYTGLMGAAGVVDSITSCAVNIDAFRPDGDDGAGQEADGVDLMFSSASAPAWWVVEVADAFGALVEVEYLAPNGPLDAWTWDGRDSSGRVVDAGNWTLSVSAEGSFGGRSAPCSRQVELMQRGVR